MHLKVLTAPQFPQRPNDLKFAQVELILILILNLRLAFMRQVDDTQGLWCSATLAPEGRGEVPC